jgi:hypothetical protein
MDPTRPSYSMVVRALINLSVERCGEKCKGPGHRDYCQELNEFIMRCVKAPTPSKENHP